MHSWPRPCVIMKLTISGVTFSAAQMKSPSFSRSSASTTMTTRPLADGLDGFFDRGEMGGHAGCLTGSTLGHRAVRQHSAMLTIAVLSADAGDSIIRLI